MAFNGNGVRLAGDDGALQKASFGAEILGDGLAALPVPTVSSVYFAYLVIKIAAASAFPAPALGGDSIISGDILILKQGDSITPATDDNVVTLDLADRCDISSWGLEFSAAEIDATTLCDKIMKYIKGKVDASGTMAGVFVTGTTDSTDGFLREFIDIKKQDGDVSFDTFLKEDTIPLGFFYVNKKVSKADLMIVITPFQLYGESLGGELGTAQTFSSPFRPAALSYTSAAGDDVEINPSFYRIGDGL